MRQVTFEQPRDDYVHSLNWVAELTSSRPSNQLSLPTPCAEYDIRTLIGQVIGTAERGLGTAQGRSTRHIPHVVTDITDEKLAFTFADVTERVTAAWARLSGDEIVTASWGDCAALQAVQGYPVETATHGWDLAVATGPSDAPPGVAERCVLRPQTWQGWAIVLVVIAVTIAISIISSH